MERVIIDAFVIFISYDFSGVFLEMNLKLSVRRSSSYNCSVYLEMTWANL